MCQLADFLIKTGIHLYPEPCMAFELISHLLLDLTRYGHIMKIMFVILIIFMGLQHMYLR
ncbi:unnamed protein product [Meloidogyne enterolobii]|uniref:Uncharacterized protein n=1 Tax=Meloidogyne enterolobii TaxID=390850 RepID=A0ACB0ZSD7_MELEN